MKSPKVYFNASVSFIILLCGMIGLRAQSTALLYQGLLKDGANTVRGTYDFTFTLFDTDTGGAVVAGPLTNSAVVVNAGIFTVLLDFGGNPFIGALRWLEISIRSGDGTEEFILLSPRQRLQVTPYAISAGNLNGLGATNFAQIGEANSFRKPQTFLGPVVFGEAVSFQGAIRAPLRVQGDSSCFAELQAGNSQVVLTAGDASGNHQGTALHIQSGGGIGPDKHGGNIVFLPGLATGQGQPGRVVVEGNVEVTGSISATTLLGEGSELRNVAASNLIGVVGSAQLAGAYSNAVQLHNAANQFQGGFTGDGAGLGNLRAAALNGTLPQSALAGTYDNALNLMNPANAIRGTFTGDASGLTSLNAAALATGTVADVRLSANVALLNSSPAFSGSVTAAGDLAGTRLNVGTGHTLTGQFATIAGGQSNLATGKYSQAAGRRARASHDGAFVWADSTDADFGSSVTDQFLIRAGGGVGINTTNSAGKALAINGAAGISGTNTLEFGADVAGKHPNAGRIGYQTFTPGALDIVGAGTNATTRRIKFWAERGATFNGTGTNSLVVISNTVDESTSLSFSAPFSTWRIGQNKPPDAPNAFDSFFIYQQSAGATRLLITDSGRVGIGTNNPVYPLHLASGAFCSLGGQWTSVSDRQTKADFRSIAPRDVLSKVAALPVTQWRYKAETNGVKHLGPTAQDFHAAFGLGESDKVIGAVDANGVALAAIQGLNEVVKEKDAEIRALKAKNEQIEERLKLLETRLRLPQ